MQYVFKFEVLLRLMENEAMHFEEALINENILK